MQWVEHEITELGMTTLQKDCMIVSMVSNKSCHTKGKLFRFFFFFFALKLCRRASRNLYWQLLLCRKKKEKVGRKIGKKEE